MYNKILVPVALDHDRDVAGAFAIARRLLAEGGRITALTVMEEIPSYATQYLPDGTLENRRIEAEKSLAAVVGDAEDVTPVVIHGHAARSIEEYAEDHAVDCIVIASHRPGMQDYFLGSTAARVVRHAPCSVHVLR